MKLSVFLFIAFLCTSATYAQTGAQGTFLEQDQQRVTNSGNDQSSDFSLIEMSDEKDSVTFSGLPVFNKKVSVVITNTDGEEVKSGNLTNERTAVNISKLHKGMYFVTLLYKGASRKGFVLHKD